MSLPKSGGAPLGPPAAGLLLTGMVAFASCIIWLLATYYNPNPFWFTAISKTTVVSAAERLVYLVPPVLGLWAAGCLVVGAVHMMRLRSYALAVVATMLAMLPWSPAWILGVPFGIWALVVLRRPEVRAAFLNNRRREGSALPGKQEPKGPVTGKIASFFRTVAGYMLPTSVGKSPLSHPSAAAPETQEPMAPSSGVNRASGEIGG